MNRRIVKLINDSHRHVRDDTTAEHRRRTDIPCSRVTPDGSACYDPGLFNQLRMSNILMMSRISSVGRGAYKAPSSPDYKESVSLSLVRYETKFESGNQEKAILKGIIRCCVFSFFSVEFFKFNLVIL